MSFTLRGAISSTWNTIKYATPVMGPIWAAQDLAKTKTFQDCAKWTADTSKKAAATVNNAANAVLDYKIDEGIQKGAKVVGDAAVAGWDATCETAGDVKDVTVAAGKAYVNYEVAKAVAIKDGAVAAGNFVADKTVKAYDATAQAAVDAKDAVVQTTIDGANYVDEAQKVVRRDIAKSISPD